MAIDAASMREDVRDVVVKAVNARDFDLIAEQLGSAAAEQLPRVMNGNPRERLFSGGRTEATA